MMNAMQSLKCCACFLLMHAILREAPNGFGGRYVPAVEVSCDLIMSRRFLQHWIIFLHSMVDVHLQVCTVMSLVNILE